MGKLGGEAVGVDFGTRLGYPLSGGEDNPPVSLAVECVANDDITVAIATDDETICIK